MNHSSTRDIISPITVETGNRGASITTQGRNMPAQIRKFYEGIMLDRNYHLHDGCGGNITRCNTKQRFQYGIAGATISMSSKT